MATPLEYPCEKCGVVEAYNENVAYCNPCNDQDKYSKALETLQDTLDFLAVSYKLDKEELIKQLTKAI